jgi:hypothetical protein
VRRQQRAAAHAWQTQRSRDATSRQRKPVIRPIDFSPGLGAIMWRMSDDEEFDHGDRVNQAVGIVRDQANCSLEEAFVLMHERATVTGSSMQQVIDAVVDGNICFRD